MPSDQELEAKLLDFKAAASALSEEWEHHAGDAIDGYPSYLPSFEEFTLDVQGMEVTS